MWDLLQSLGLTEYKSKILYSLAELGSGTVKNVATRAKLPQNKVYEALEELEREGIVSSQAVRPKVYAIQSLDVLRRKATDKQTEVQRALVTLEKLEKLSVQSAPEQKEMFWTIKGQRNIIARLNVETEGLKFESLSVVRNLQSKPESIRLLTEAVKRGVDVRFLCAQTVHAEQVAKWRDSGIKVRIYDDALSPVGTRFTVLDKRSVRITIGAPEVASPEEYITLWCESRSFAGMMRNQFFSMWKKAKPVKF